MKRQRQAVTDRYKKRRGISECREVSYRFVFIYCNNFEVVRKKRFNAASGFLLSVLVIARQYSF